MAGGLQWSVYTAVVLFLVHAAHSPRSSQELFCVNDFVRDVTCTWRQSPFDPSSVCWVSGVRTTFSIIDNKRQPKHIVRRCKLKQHGEFPGCTFSFDSEPTFNAYEIMPNISVTCNSTVVGTYPKFSLNNHIKMHPPSTPSVSSSVNVTRISWDPGSPRSKYLPKLNFEVQIKQIRQSWDEVVSQPTSDQQMLIWQKLKGPHQVRVRVKPDQKDNSHWSDWSPTTSWVADDGAATSQEEELSQALLIWGTPVLILGLTSASLLVLYRCCVRKTLMSEKTVPSPSKYVCTLHSTHGGNLKKWLNLPAASNSFFVAHPCEEISAVEVCDSWDVAISTSPCSTSALIHFPPAESTHHMDHLSSCSSSCFSNMGYFMSSCNSSLAQTHTGPYFSDQGNVLSPHKKLHVSLRPSFTSLSIYKSLRKEPQSPDSGFEIGKFEDQDMEVLDDNHCSPLLLHLPPSVTSLTPTPSHPSALNLVFDDQVLEEDAPTAASPAASENLSAWPVAGAMCRASSLPVDSCKSGYLTLKELQTTFSNKSI